LVKIRKYGEKASPFIKKKKKKKRRSLTSEEKEYKIDHIKNKIRNHKRLVGRMVINPCRHEETIRDGKYIICRYCGEIIK